MSINSMTKGEGKGADGLFYDTKKARVMQRYPSIPLVIQSSKGELDDECHRTTL